MKPDLLTLPHDALQERMKPCMNTQIKCPQLQKENPSKLHFMSIKMTAQSR